MSSDKVISRMRELLSSQLKVRFCVQLLEYEQSFKKSKEVKEQNSRT